MTGPVLKTTVLDYRYGLYSFLALIEDVVYYSTTVSVNTF